MFNKINKLLLIGAGKIGSSMLNGWLSSELNINQIYVQDPCISFKMKKFLIKHNILFGSTTPIDFNPEVIILAVKPQIISSILPNIKLFITKKNLLISLIAGKKILYFEKNLGEKLNIIRIMTNTPIIIQNGMSVLIGNKNITKEHKKISLDLTKTIGFTKYIKDENLMDAITAISGSGPAYIFYIAEIMIKAGIKAGLSKDLAYTLTTQTIQGSGNLMVKSNDKPDILRKNVTSPNGVTFAGLAELTKNNQLENLMIKTIFSAIKKSKELN